MFCCQQAKRRHDDGHEARNRANLYDVRREILPSPPFGISRLSPSTDVFQPLHKPIECLHPSTEIHGCLPVLLSVLLSKVTEKMQGVSVFPRACTRRKKSRNLCWLRLFPYACVTHQP